MSEELSLSRAREQLMRRREELMSRRDEYDEDRRDLLARDAPPEFAESARRDEDLGLLDALTVSETRELKDIDEALTKIEDGTYGTCENCGEPIDPKRLEVMPHAHLCIACREIEARERPEAS